MKLLLNIIKYKTLTNIVIVDNKSTDDSFEILSGYASEKVHVLQTSRNGGYGYGNNFGVKYAYHVLHSEYIMIVNPDVEVTEGCIIALRDTLKDDSTCAVSSAVPLTPVGNRQSVIAWKLPTVKDYVLTASMFYNKFFSKMQYSDSYFKDKDICQVDCIPGSLLMVNARLMIEHGMYDEDMFLYCEETTLGFKFKQHGLKTVLLLNQSYIHWHSMSISKTISSARKRRKLTLNSRTILIKKYYNATGFKLFLTKLFLKLALFENTIIYMIKGED